MNIKSKMNNLSKQKGMSLIEVLIAALILGVALLSIAMMQINALKTSTNSSNRAMASDVASSLASRMRMNIPGVMGSDLLTTSDNQYISSWASGSCSATPIDCTDPTAGSEALGGCNAIELAAWDLYEATCAPDIGLNDLLPGSKMDVSCVLNVVGDKVADIPIDNCLIKIQWLDSGKVEKDGTLIDSGLESLTLKVVPGVPKTNKDSTVKI